MPKTVYDAMFYNDQPDLRPLGFQPIYMMDDGVVNRAGYPEDNNVSPSGLNTESAFRRVARAAIGVQDDIVQHSYCRPKAYNRVYRPVCMDFEDQQMLNALDGASTDSRKRIEYIDFITHRIKNMREEAAYHGQSVFVGSYCPMWKFANLNSNDPSFKGRMEIVEKDMQPLVDALDAFFPPCEIHSPDLELWKTNVRAVIDYAKVIAPDKPIYPLVPPHYSHYADPSIRWYLMSPTKMWIPAITWLLQQPEINGMIMWGGWKFLHPTTALKGKSENEELYNIFRRPYMPEPTRLQKIASLRTGSEWFDPWLPIRTFAINAGLIGQKS